MTHEDIARRFKPQLIALLNDDHDSGILADPEFDQAIYEYYLPDMPYGTAKARTGDPSEFIFHAVEEEFSYLLGDEI